MSSLINLQGDAVLNFDFKVTDDGATPGIDALPTLINKIIISQGTGNDVGTWTDAITGALLYDGTNTKTGTINATDITFSGITNGSGELGYIADDGNKTYQLKVWLKDNMGGALKTTIDGSNLAFLVNRGSFTVEVTGSSGFLTGDGTPVESGNSNNAVAVTATKLDFTAQPPATTVTNTNLSTKPVVTARDANNNTDLDYGSNVDVTNSGGLGMSNVPTAMSNGMLTFPPDFQFTAAGGPVTLTVAENPPSGLTDATSDAFTVIEPPSFQTDIVPGGSDSVNVRYINYLAGDITTSNALKAWSFRIREGGSDSTDGDIYPTILDTLRILKGAQNTVASWSGNLYKAALYVGATELQEAAVTGENIVFGGLNDTVQESSTKIYDLYLTFHKNVVDNQQFQFKIDSDSISHDPSGSGFMAFACSSNVANDTNRIEVVATVLNFYTQPPDTILLGEFFLAGVEAVDDSLQRDKDAAGNVTLGLGSGTGNLTSASSLTKNINLNGTGYVGWNDLKYDTQEGGIALATTNALGLRDTASDKFVCIVPDTNTWRSKATGKWDSSGTWEYWDEVTSTWRDTTGEPASTNNVLVRAGHTVTMNGSPKNCRNLVVESGGTLYTGQGSNRYLRVYGDSIRIDGAFGGATDGISVDCYQPVRFCGSGAMDLSRLRPAAKNVEIILGGNVNLHFSGAALFCNNMDSTTFTVNSGSTLSFGNASFFSPTTNQNGSSSLSLTMNIQGVVSLKPGMNFNMSVYSPCTATLKIGGTLYLGDSLYCGGTGVEAVNIVEGGMIDTTNGWVKDTIRFDCLTVNSSSGFAPKFDMLVKSDLAIQSGTFNDNGRTIPVQRDLSNASSHSGSGKIMLTGGSAPHVISGSGTYQNLELNDVNGASLAASSNPTVNGTLTLTSGKLTTGSNTITLGSSATITEGTSSYVVGNVQTTRTLAQSANETFGGLGLEINAAGAAPGATAVTRVTGTAFGSGSHSIKRYFDISPAMNFGLDATMVFRYLADELNGISEANLSLFRSTDAGLHWIEYGGHVNTADDSLTLSGIIEFSLWTLGDKTQPMAVEFSSFSALSINYGITLSWRTESENGSYMWIVERSTDANGGYVELARLTAAGQSTSPKEYTWSDTQATAGITYFYRIGELALDGTINYYGPVQCQLDRGLPVTDLLLGSRPNPFRHQTAIEYQVSREARVSLAIYNVAGQLVKKLDEGTLQPGYYHSGWDGTDANGTGLSTGLYLYRLSIGQKGFTGKVLLVR